MITCNWVQNRILMYLESELADAEAQRVGRHLEKCSRCSRTMEYLLGAQDRLEAALPTRVSAPSTLHRRVMSRIEEPVAAERISRPQARQAGPRPPAWALALSLAVLLAVGGAVSLWNPRNPSPQLAAMEEIPLLPTMALRADYARFAADAVQIPGAEPAIVADDLARQLGRSIAAIDLRPIGGRLQGGRETDVAGVRSGALVYDWQGSTLMLYQIESSKFRLPALEEIPFGEDCFLVASEPDCTLVIWCEGDSHFVIAGNVSPESLLTVAIAARGAVSEA
jgi:anti-sigma factor RsiW